MSSSSFNQMHNKPTHYSSTRHRHARPCIQRQPNMLPMRLTPYGPGSLPPIKLLFKMADSPTPIPPSFSLTLPPIKRSAKLCSEHPYFLPPPLGHDTLSKVGHTTLIGRQEGSRSPPKRKQVKRACSNCQKACKGCAETRPCPRCLLHGIADSCVDAPRKSDAKAKTKQPSV